MMTRKGMTMYLNEKQLERDQKRRENDGLIYDVYFEDDVQLNSLNFEYDDWEQMGRPDTITLHIYPGKRNEDTVEMLTEVYRDAREDMLIAEHKLEVLNGR